jgi:hypothetical protein
MPIGLLRRHRPLHKVYADELRYLELGDALLNPQPIVRRRGAPDPPVNIGDVGYVKEGQWHHLFNIHRMPDDQPDARLPVRFEYLSNDGSDMKTQKSGPRQFSSASDRSATMSVGGSVYVTQIYQVATL